eukprot:3889988-Alexandrium_andersonii.AAC.1
MDGTPVKVDMPGRKYRITGNRYASDSYPYRTTWAKVDGHWRQLEIAKWWTDMPRPGEMLEEE